VFVVQVVEALLPPFLVGEVGPAPPLSFCLSLPLSQLRPFFFSVFSLSEDASSDNLKVECRGDPPSPTLPLGVLASRGSKRSFVQRPFDVLSQRCLERSLLLLRPSGYDHLCARCLFSGGFPGFPDGITGKRRGCPLFPPPAKVLFPPPWNLCHRLDFLLPALRAKN